MKLKMIELSREQPYASEAQDYIIETFVLDHDQSRMLDDTVISLNNPSHRTRIYLDTQDKRFSQLSPRPKLKRLRLTKYDSQKGSSTYFLEVKYEETRGNERFVGKIRLPLLNFRNIHEFLHKPISKIDLDYLSSLPAELQILNPAYSSIPAFNKARQAILKEIGEDSLVAVVSSEYSRQSTGKIGKRITIDRCLLFRNLERKDTEVNAIDELFAEILSIEKYESNNKIIELKGKFSPESIEHLTKTLSLRPYSTKFQEAVEKFSE